MLNAAALVGTHDVLFVTLDTLRYDVAVATLERGMTPGLARLLPGGRWEERHSPGNFTYAAHHAFFAGFLPTPAAPGLHPRLFAAQFPGSETTTTETCVFDEADIVAGFAQRGYHTACVGGVGFFNKLSPLGRVLPNMFAESHWSEALGVTSADSTENQVDVAMRIVDERRAGERLFLFVNVSALHQPNCIFANDANEDSAETQAAALAYVDGHLPRLIEHMRERGPTMCIITSDHGTAYGEDGYWGHRVNHPVVWTVPYAEFVVTPEPRTNV
ncbi:MAG: STM4013/SEN3800 family hydrolase [Pirellulales bacterium]|nr:STM4013/SEN3800 family hydrolase [Pirellulales bacterium]